MQPDLDAELDAKEPDRVWDEFRCEDRCVDHAEVETLIEESLVDLSAAGIAVSVAAGSVTVVRSHGTVLGHLVTPETTVMYAASLTKQMVGYLAAVAVEEGRLDYDAPVVHYLPDLPTWTSAVRVRHLVHHTSGLPEVTEPHVRWPEGNAVVTDRLRAWTGCPATPGVAFAYCNTGYVLLAEAVGAVHGAPIGQLAAERIFEPLGMSSSRLGGRPRSLPGCPDPPGTIGDGGLWTTVNDLSLWLSGMNDDRPEPAAAQRIQRPGRVDDGIALDYGWGVRITQTDAGEMITHGGSWPGWLSKTVRCPKRNVAVAVLSHDRDEQTISHLGLTLAKRATALASR